MGNNPSDDSLQRVSECIVIADYLIERGRFEQALELLIEAIKIAPEYPISYAKRALVCDEMGLSAQADADRQRVLQLASKPGSSPVRSSEGDAKAAMERARAALMGSPEPDDAKPSPPPSTSSGASDPAARAEAPAQPEPPAPDEPADVGGSAPPPPSPSAGHAEVPAQPEPPAPVAPADVGGSAPASPTPPGADDPSASAGEDPAQPEPPAPPESADVGDSEPKPRPSASSRGIVSVFFTLLMIGGAIAAVIGGIVFAISEFDGGEGSPNLVASPLGDTSTPDQTTTLAPTQTATPIPTAVPTPLRSPAPISGVPFSLSSVTNGWEAAGFTITIRGDSDRLSGFSIGATDVSLAGPAGTGEFTVLVYADDEAPDTDWDLLVGELPDPKPGRTLPEHNTIWWNSNIIAVVRTISGDVTDALDALFQMTP